MGNPRGDIGGSEHREGDRRDNDSDWYDAEEARRRGDALVKRMLSMPPKPQEEMKLGKPRGRKQGPELRGTDKDDPLDGNDALPGRDRHV